LAIAFLYEHKVKNVGVVSILGGQYTGVGNVIGKYSAEANFNHDPQATHIIIHVTFLNNEEFCSQFIRYSDRKSA